MERRRSARAIIVRDELLALIERRRAGELFYVFPGGSIEPAETSAAAVVREGLEELGVHILPERIVAQVTFPDRIQDFWLARIVGGTFGSGTGLEMTAPPTERGSYRPVWMPVNDVTDRWVRPASVINALSDLLGRSWPETPLQLVETDEWWHPPPA